MKNATVRPKVYRLYMPWDSIHKCVSVRAVEVIGTNQVRIHSSRVTQFVENDPDTLRQHGYYPTPAEAIEALDELKAI